MHSSTQNNLSTMCQTRRLVLNDLYSKLPKLISRYRYFMRFGESLFRSASTPVRASELTELKAQSKGA